MKKQKRNEKGRFTKKKGNVKHRGAKRSFNWMALVKKFLKIIFQK